MLDFNEDKQNKHIEELRKKEEEELIKILSDKYGVPYLDLTTVSIEGDALRTLPEARARETKIAPFKVVGKKLFVGSLSPSSDQTKIVLQELEEKHFQIELFMVSNASLERAWDRYKDISASFETKAGVLDISNEFLEEISQKIKNIDDIKAAVADTSKQNRGHKISEMFEIIIAGAVSTKASDIHIEPEEESVKLRYRIDGVLEDIMFFDYETYKLMNSRVKLLSGLKLNVKNDAQDGRFSIKIGGQEIEIRSSVLPGAYGESIVLRILNPDAISVTFEDLGISAKLFHTLENEIKRPNGIILTTGPTGSGKTTTLYAFLRKIYSPGIKIITIENPIEYHLNGITQTQTNEEDGYTFLSGIRAALRQDPDVIMVGEIRDEETAKIAIDAALTGHLVFSTLHTNTAAGAIPRLIDLGVNAKIISSALNVSIAQRLLRKLCTYCKKEDAPNERELLIINKVLESIKTEKKDQELTEIKWDATGKESKIWRAVGCDKCNNTGYKGRTGVYEAILADENIEKAITENPTEREIKKMSESQGILDMTQDGIIKVVKGVTSLDELERVVEI